MEEHEGDQIQGRGGERRGYGADGRCIPDPPDGQRIPEYECKRGPSEHAPPVAPGFPQGVADPQQGYEPCEERHARDAEPTRREEDGRKDYRCKTAQHGGSFL